MSTFANSPSAQQRTTGDSVGLDPRTGGDPLASIDDLCRAKGWSRTRLARELRRQGQRRGVNLPGDESLVRMIRQWANGTRRPNEQYRALLCAALGVAPADESDEGEPDAFASLIAAGAHVVDVAMVEVFEAQTDMLRLIDRKMGAARALPQVEAHMTTMVDLLDYAPYGQCRSRLASAAGAAAALAAWQALDLGRPKQAWELHGQSRRLALEACDVSLVAYTTAQQAYALLDAGDSGRAREQMQHARLTAGTQVPTVLRAWLAAAEGEAAAADGDRTGASRCLDDAAAIVARPDGDTLPYVFLGAGHLARWRGNCLAAVGDREATAILVDALDTLDPTFNRAAASLHADLSTAFAAQGDSERAGLHARAAADYVRLTGSIRQRRRVEALVAAHREHAQ